MITVKLYTDRKMGCNPRWVAEYDDCFIYEPTKDAVMKEARDWWGDKVNIVYVDAPK